MGLSDAVKDILTSNNSNPSEETLEKWLKDAELESIFFSGYINGLRDKPYPNNHMKATKSWYCFEYGMRKSKD